MLEFVDPPSQSARILAWYALIQEVYELADGSACSGSAAPAALSALLGKAAAYLGFEELAYMEGSLPDGAEPGELLLSLPGRSRDPHGCDAQRVFPASTEVCSADVKLCYLRARSLGGAHAADASRAELQRFVGHLARALSLREHEATARRSLVSLYEALDAHELAVVLCDAAGRPRFSNRAATCLRQRYPELATVEGTEAPLARLFRDYKRSLRRGASQVVRVATDALQLTLIPLLSHAMTAVFALDGPSLGVVIHELAQPIGAAGAGAPGMPPVPDALGRNLEGRHRLTAAEVRLSWALCFGLSLPSYAALTQRSPLTLRRQLKSVFRKLNVRDQKGLVMRIWLEQTAQWSELVTFSPTQARSFVSGGRP